MLNKSIRVCHVTMLFHPYFSGHGIYLEKVFKFLTKRNITNMILTANYNGFKSDETIDSIPVHRIRIKRKWKKWDLIFTIQAILFLLRKRHDFDIIHLHGLWDIYGLFTIFSKLFGKKILLHMVLLGSDDPLAVQQSHKLMTWRMRLLSLQDAFISISSPISQSFKNTSLPQRKLFQIPQGVDTEKFFPASSNEKTVLRTQLGLPVSQKIVTFVGAIIIRKGVDVLIDAWLEVNNQFKDALLLLIGPDTPDGLDVDDVEQFESFVSRLKNKIKEHNLNTMFLGKSDKVNLLLKASDIFVLPSRFEGFGNVVIEAMSCEIPVIVTEMNGVASDLVLEGKQGFIIKDQKELKEKLLYLLANDDIRIAMGSEARKRAVEAFEMGKICDQYSSLYAGLLNRP